MSAMQRTTEALCRMTAGTFSERVLRGGKSSSLFYGRAGPRFAVPETALAYCRRIEREVLEIMTDLSEYECIRIIEELAIVDWVVYQTAERVKNRPAYDARMRLPQPVAPGHRLLPAGGHLVEVGERLRGANRADAIYVALQEAS